MGRVGGLVSEHLAKKLDCKLAAKITISGKPWVNLQNGLVEIPSDEYRVFVNPQKSIVVFTGDNQPQDGNTVYELCHNLMSLVHEMGKIELVISSGGYFPAKLEAGDRVFGVATSKDSLERLTKLGIEPLGSDVNSITWFNGLILGFAKTDKIEGIGLFGEIADTEKPQYKAAKNIIKIIGRLLDIDIDTKEIEKQEGIVPSQVKRNSPGVG